MSANRMLYVLVVPALLVVAFFVFQQAASAGAIARANRSNAQAVQRQDAILRSHRGGLNPTLLFHAPSMTTSGTGAPIADRAYDEVENLRAQRTSP